MPWIWQHPDWPVLRWDTARHLQPIAALARSRGRLLAELEALGLDARRTVEARVLVEEAESTSKIEGLPLPPASVRSSVARRLGLDAGGLPAPRRDIDGLVEVLSDATSDHSAPLTEARLFDWHAALFPTGRSGMQPIVVAGWRQTPVSVRSGAIGGERVHYQAPPPERVPAEMTRFLAWWRESGAVEGALRAGVAHLWFETIHPFEDGNGRLGRALADMALARADDAPRRAYSLSRQISAERPRYYRALEAAQRGDLQLDGWLDWFIGCVDRAVERSQGQLGVAQLRAALRQQLAAQPLNPRQQKALLKLIEAEPGGFTGGLSNEKYRHITRASRATAARDLAELVALGLLRQSEAGGRSTRYALNRDRWV